MMALPLKISTVQKICDMCLTKLGYYYYNNNSIWSNCEDTEPRCMSHMANLMSSWTSSLLRLFRYVAGEGEEKDGRIARLASLGIVFVPDDLCRPSI